MGAEAIRDLLSQVDLEAVALEIREDSAKTSSDAKRKKLAKRLKIVDSFRESGQRPEWMVLEVIPVLPPDLQATRAPGRRPLRHLAT